MGIAGRDDLSAITDFIDTFDLSAFDHIVDDDGTLWRSYGIVTQPSFIFIDDTGETATYVGALGRDRLLQLLNDLTS